jgi:hypothetical protein
MGTDDDLDQDIEEIEHDDSGEDSDGDADGDSWGQLRVFNSGEALCEHFQENFPEARRGALLNEDVNAPQPRGTMDDGRNDGPPNPLVAWLGLIGRAIGNRVVLTPETTTVLLHQQEVWRAVWEGYGMARRQTTSTPPGTDPVGHRQVHGVRALRAANAAGLALDILNSIGQSMDERTRIMVVIHRPARTGTDWANDRQPEPFHCVLIRPATSRDGNIVLGPWELAPPQMARSYLQSGDLHRGQGEEQGSDQTEQEGQDDDARSADDSEPPYDPSFEGNDDRITRDGGGHW